LRNLVKFRSYLGFAILANEFYIFLLVSADIQK